MITSMQNKRVKQWKKLHTKKGRQLSKTFLIEGYHLVEEAHKSCAHILEIIVPAKGGVSSPYDQYPVYRVSDQIFQHLSQTERPQDMIAVVKKMPTQKIIGNHLLLVDAVQDPGNLGTIIRTADAAGFSGVILGEGTVDVFNDKVIRATQGSIFHLPIVNEINLLDYIRKLKHEGYEIWASALQQSVDYTHIEPSPKTALILGNEGAGIREEVLNLADVIVKIPIYGKAESLNVSVAAGILMYRIVTPKGHE